MQDIIENELLVIHIEIGKPTIDWAFGKQLLQLFADHDSRLVPQSLSVWEDKVADFSGVDGVQQHWAGKGQMRIDGSLIEFHVGLGWRRKRNTSYQAEINHESRDTRGRLIPATLDVYAKPQKKIDWRGFVNKLYELTEARYGFAHLCRDAGVGADLSEAREPTWGIGQRTPTSVPQLGWSTFFGPLYAEFFSLGFEDRQDVDIAKIGDGIAITLSDNIMDVADSFEVFSQTRTKVKADFPENFFDII